MKNRNLIASTIILFVLSSCGSTSSFDTPNSLRNIRGTLFLTNGKSIDGRLVIQKGNLFSSDVKIYTEDDSKPMQFTLSEVEGYTIRNDYYALREIKGGISLGRRLSFMKRITSDKSRIHLYENVEKNSETRREYGNNVSRTYYETEYYMELPDEKGAAVYALSSSKFVPNFDEKMSSLVSDCPSLSRKIAAKEKGYFYAQVSLIKEKRVETLLTIIDEYNGCGGK